MKKGIERCRGGEKKKEKIQGADARLLSYDDTMNQG